MKKYITTSLLIISMFAGLFGSTGTGTYAEAAVKTAKLSTPCVTAVKKSAKVNQLSIGKVKGATEYKVYSADSKNGTYKCIGTTKSTVFKDIVNKNENCYYKVKACKNGKAASTYSKTVKPKTKKNASNTTTNTNTGANNQTSGSTVTSSNESYANEVLKLVNQERAKAGLGALTTNADLQKAANKRAQEIVSSFAHNRPDGRSFSTVLGEYGISYRASGENIAYGQKTPSEVMNGWMNSSGHRANILGSQFGKVGIGVYKASNGTYYWTQIFTN